MKTRHLTEADFVGPSRSSGTQISYQHCPVCGADNWKTYLNPATGAWYCFAGQHSGGGKINVGASFSPMADLRDKLARTNTSPEWPQMDMPPNYPFGYRARRYLEARGFDPDRCAALGLAEHRTEERIVIPFPGSHGKYIYWSARAYAAGIAPKYLSAPGKHPLYVLPRWQPHDTVVLVEGPMDALAVYMNTGLPTIALCGKSLPKYLEPDLLHLVTKHCIVMLDGSALGDALKIAMRLRSRVRTTVVPIPADADPADLGPHVKEYIDEVML